MNLYTRNMLFISGLYALNKSESQAYIADKSWKLYLYRGMFRWSTIYLYLEQVFQNDYGEYDTYIVI